MRFDLAPLLERLGLATPLAAIRALHISGATFRRLRNEGLSVNQADRLACRAGLHPGEVWPEWWWFA